MLPSFAESPFSSKREYEAFLKLPQSQQMAAISAAPKRTAALQVQLDCVDLSGRNRKRKADNDPELVSIKSNSDRVVLCKLEAAQLSGMLARGLGTSGSLQLSQTGFTVPFPAEILILIISALERSLLSSGDEQCTQLILESVRHLVADDFFALFAAAKYLECEQLSMSLCCHLAALLRGKSPSEIREEFDIADDMSLEIEAVSLNEPVIEPPSGAYSANTRVAPGGALAPPSSGEQPAVMNSGDAQPPPPGRQPPPHGRQPPPHSRSLSARMGDEDSVQELLKACELRTLRTLKGVSFAWRERARLALSSVDSAWRQHTFAPRSELAARLELSRMQYIQAIASSASSTSSDVVLVNLEGGARRLKTEWMDMQRDRDAYIEAHVLTIAPVSDLYHWRCDILGPAGTPYAGGCFELELTVPDNYPYQPPAARFVTKILHPNIDRENGAVSVSILGDGPDNEWSPAYKVIAVVVGLVSLLNEPNFDSPVAPDLAHLHRDNPSEYERTVLGFTQKHAK